MTGSVITAQTGSVMKNSIRLFGENISWMKLDNVPNAS
jgi:hypothetical protein